MPSPPPVCNLAIYPAIDDSKPETPGNRILAGLNRLLLRQTMQRAKSQHEIHRVNAHDRPVFE